MIRRYSRRVLERADALHSDCMRDIYLAMSWGFSEEKPWICCPGNAGVDSSMFCPGDASDETYSRIGLDRSRALVLNPRGLRRYVDSAAWFDAIRALGESRPDIAFASSAMDSEAAHRLASRRHAERFVELLPSLNRADMADLFRAASVVVSPSYHDGTPNTLLEAMAVGCVPVVGKLTSIEEWITDGENGILCEPGSAASIAAGIRRAVDDEELRSRATSMNRSIIENRAARDVVIPQIASFYEQVVGR